ncbi:VTT domain-containing protein [Kineococcus rhizosphaerae]|uniref:Membrane protein DedA with SNARE-associated domain n=1 Tax=Kineococcus rhizosphaerae TaxID=559628 RepID=A0A2T0R5L7_9ACTN|nr:VTT domain-containing protein [Kineococcus rhizosphaerae]PRY16063.1 membrane protein DedA with SNARE-associated domain [Kineococcus rhizosphaerae]
MLTDLLNPTAHADNWLWALCVLLAAVVLGALLPVLPTGAVVSAMAALGHHRSWVSLGEVVVVGAAAAYVADVVLYTLLLRGAHTRLGRRLQRRAEAHGHLDELGERLSRHDVGTLVTSRLLPGARIPVLAAAAATEYPVVRFAVANVVPAVCWALAYALLGLAGRGVSDRPWVSVVAAVAFGLAASGVVSLVRRLRAR